MNKEKSKLNNKSQKRNGTIKKKKLMKYIQDLINLIIEKNL